MADQKDTLATLNDLIETCKDGQEGFRTASEGVGESDLKQLFSSYSLQRSKFAGELQSEAKALGDKTPEETSSLAGAAHRGWINLKAALTSKERHSILSECERGEDIAVAAYKQALETELPANIREIVERQSRDVKAAHDKIKALRDASAK
ncbi:MAG: PA2169 family four-helix-bundle protein [Verrucomicrobiota bacterium]|nr:PA2169 family four-helix-bundle protein [Verrucomicrobiota bacterium]